jgi:hypothetical protein
MKQTILTLGIVAGLLAGAPVLQARDHDHDYDRYHEDYRSDVHSLWEWYGHLRDEANARGGHHTRDELEAIRYNLKRVSDEVNDHHYRGDRVRSEIDGIRDDLRHVNSELKWHGEVHHRSGFTIDIR